MNFEKTLDNIEKNDIIIDNKGDNKNVYKIQFML